MQHLELEKLPAVEPNPPKNAPGQWHTIYRSYSRDTFLAKIIFVKCKILVLKIRGLLHRDRAEKHDENGLTKVLAKREKRERKRKATEHYIKNIQKPQCSKISKKMGEP